MDTHVTSNRKGKNKLDRMPHSVSSSLCGLLVTSILLLVTNTLGIFQSSLEDNFHHKPPAHSQSQCLISLLALKDL